MIFGFTDTKSPEQKRKEEAELAEEYIMFLYHDLGCTNLKVIGSNKDYTKKFEFEFKNMSISCLYNSDYQSIHFSIGALTSKYYSFQMTLDQIRPKSHGKKFETEKTMFLHILKKYSKNRIKQMLDENKIIISINELLIKNEKNKL